MTNTITGAPADRFAAASAELASGNHTSAIAWPAVIGGAFVAAAVSLMLLALGSGLGLASVSPWSHSGVSATTFTVMTAIWFIVVQWIASCAGGYLTGRMRLKWLNLHSDEVFFRDTANGFLAWAVATVVTAAVLVSAASSMVSGSAHMAGMMEGGNMAPPPHPAAERMGPDHGPDVTGYYVDSLYRANTQSVVAPSTPYPEVRGETTRILMNGVRNGQISPDDKAYLAQLVSARTGISQAEAARRVDDVTAKFDEDQQKVKQVAQQAKKAASAFSFFTFFSLLIGAFIASVSAAIGGRHRDMY